MDTIERRRLQSILEGLTDPGTMPVNVWCEVVEEAIRVACPPESTIHERVKALRPKPSGTPVQPDTSGFEHLGIHSSAPPSIQEIKDDQRIASYQSYIAAAKKILEFRSVDRPDIALEHEVINIIDNKLFETRAAKFIRWTVPTVLVLIFGGVLFGSYKVQGALENVKSNFAEMTKDVEKSRDAATQQIAKALGDEKQQTSALWAVRDAKERAIGRIESTLGSPDQPQTALGEIASKKKTAVEKVKQKEDEALQSLPGRVEALEQHLKGFESVALKINEARRILSNQITGVPLNAVELLLQSSAMTLAIVGAGFGFLGGLGAMTVVWLVRKILH